MGTPKIFISHSSKDKPIVDAFVDLLIRAGVSESDIFSSSTPGTHIRTGADLYECLRSILDDENVFVFLFLSDNYYSSPVCLNEMGAAWVKQVKWRYILLPGFSFDQVQGVIKQNESIGISLSPIDAMTRERFFDLKDDIENWFGLRIRANVWERARDKFFECVGSYITLMNKPINMKHLDSLCVGKFEHDGCRIKKSSDVLTTVVVDFTLTDTELCSIVYFSEYPDWRFLFAAGKQFCFDMSSSSAAIHAEMEVNVGGTNKKCDIYVSEYPKSYRIPLSQFSSSATAWGNTTEVKFLFHRKDIASPIEITIENLRLE